VQLDDRLSELYRRGKNWVEYEKINLFSIVKSQAWSKSPLRGEKREKDLALLHGAKHDYSQQRELTTCEEER
jgi:hypothetical protein